MLAAQLDDDDDDDDCIFIKMDANKTLREKARWEPQEYYEQYWTNPVINTPRNNSCMATYLPSLKTSK